MPAMRISNEDEVVRTARTALRAFNVRYEPRYEGDGRLKMCIRDSVERALDLVDRLRVGIDRPAVAGDLGLERRDLAAKLIDEPLHHPALGIHGAVAIDIAGRVVTRRNGQPGRLDLVERGVRERLVVPLAPGQPIPCLLYTSSR